jgi:hypothetical protein
MSPDTWDHERVVLLSIVQGRCTGWEEINGDVGGSVISDADSYERLSRTRSEKKFSAGNMTGMTM